jgi:hypothetical protein
VPSDREEMQAPDPPREVGDQAVTPRWVKVAAVIALVVVLLVVIALLVGGEHGPGRH